MSDVQPTFGFVGELSKEDRERLMYGRTRAELEKELLQGIAFYRHSPAFLAISMLSDVQEMVARIAVNDDPTKERARHTLNCVKALLSEFYVQRETNSERPYAGVDRRDADRRGKMSGNEKLQSPDPRHYPKYVYVFHADADEIDDSDDATPGKAGWYYQLRHSDNIPAGQPFGAFATKEEAIADMQQEFKVNNEPMEDIEHMNPKTLESFADARSWALGMGESCPTDDAVYRVSRWIWDNKPHVGCTYEEHPLSQLSPEAFWDISEPKDE